MSLHPQVNQKTLQYDPWTDARERYPDWRFEVKPLDGDAPEIISHCQKLVQLDLHYYAADPELTMAHVIAHLDEHRDSGDWFSAEICEQADYFALVRLDRGEDRI